MKKDSTGQKGSSMYALGGGELLQGQKNFDNGILRNGGDSKAIFGSFNSDPKVTNILSKAVVIEYNKLINPLAPFPEKLVDRHRAEELMTYTRPDGKVIVNFLGSNQWRMKPYNYRLPPGIMKKVDEQVFDADMLKGACPFDPNRSFKEFHCIDLRLSKFKKDPLTIARWEQIHPKGGQPCFYSYGSNLWRHNKEFATDHVSWPGFYDDLLDIVPVSLDTKYGEDEDDGQEAMVLTKGYKVPEPIDEVSKHLRYRLVNGIWLNHQAYARTCRLSGGATLVSATPTAVVSMSATGIVMIRTVFSVLRLPGSCELRSLNFQILPACCGINFKS